MKTKQLYEPMDFEWKHEQGEKQESFHATFDTFSVGLLWNKTSSSGTGRLTKFGKGKGDIKEWYFRQGEATMDGALAIMQDRALEILTKYLKKVK